MLPCLSREHVNRACGLGLFCVGIKRGKVFTSRACSRNSDPPLFFPLFLLFPLYHTLLGSPGGQGGTPWVGEVVTISAGDQEVTLLPALRPGWSFEVVSQLSCPHLNVQPPIRGEGLLLQPGAGRGGWGLPPRLLQTHAGQVTTGCHSRGLRICIARSRAMPMPLGPVQETPGGTDEDQNVTGRSC